MPHPFWATACKTVRPMLSVRCLSVLSCPVCLSVTFVHCGQTVGQIKTKLGTQVGLGPRHIVLDGDPAPLPKKGQRPQILGPCLFSPKRLDGSRCHLTVVGMEVGLSPGDFMLHGDPAPLQKGGGAPSPIFGPFLLWPNGWMHQDAT